MERAKVAKELQKIIKKNIEKMLDHVALNPFLMLILGTQNPGFGYQETPLILQKSSIFPRELGASNEMRKRIT